MNITRAFLAFAALTLAAHLASAADTAAPASPRDIPIEAFIAPPDFEAAQLSPDGKHVAFAAELGTGRRGVALMEVATGKVEPLVGPKDTDINQLFWEGNDRIVFTGRLPYNYWAGLRSISLSTREVVALSETSSFRRSLGIKANFVWVMHTLPTVHGKFMVRGFVGKGSSEYAFQLMDASNGALTTLDRNVGASTTLHVVPDRDGAIRARVRSERGRHVYEVRSDAAAEFKKAGESPWAEPGWRFLGIGGEGNTLFVVAETDSTKTSLHGMDMTSGELGPPILEVPDGSIVGVILSEDWKILHGALIEHDKITYHWFDPARARFQAQIDASLPGTFNQLFNWSEDGRVVLIRSGSDRDAGTFYLLDRRTPRISLLGRTRPKLDPKLMSPMEPIHFTSRDGLEIHGYLTKPIVAAKQPAPMIVYPHYGPFDTRDSWGFDPWVQLFASRGYSVLQVNFRGSTGYGTAFEKAGWKEVGGKMEDDLTDAVEWAVHSGAADRSRVAIFGYGYGGLAALTAIARTPDLYRCAVNYWGDYDFDNEVGADYSNGRFSRDYIDARWREDPETRSERAIHNLVEKFGAPSLHIYSWDDKDYHDRWWMRIKNRMIQHNKPFEEVIIKDDKLQENHQKHSLAVAHRVMDFLAKHMPPDG